MYPTLRTRYRPVTTTPAGSSPPVCARTWESVLLSPSSGKSEQGLHPALRALRASFAHRRRSKTRLLASWPHVISSRESPPPSSTSDRDATARPPDTYIVPSRSSSTSFKGQEFPKGVHSPPTFQRLATLIGLMFQFGHNARRLETLY